MNEITPYLLDLDDERLWHGSLEVPLSPKEFSILKLFIQRPDRLLKKEEILNEIWPHTCITEGLIKDYVRHLRRALGDDSRNPRFIETVHRRGYRFIGRITIVQDKRMVASWAATAGEAHQKSGDAT